MPNLEPMSWFRLYTKGWLDGSIRSQLTPAERSVWCDLLCLASESRERGKIQRSKGTPYTYQQLANSFDIPLDLLVSTIEKCAKDGNPDNPLITRIIIEDDGSLTIGNWDTYQTTPETKKKLTGRELELVQRVQLNKLAAKYPIEALNVPEVRAMLENEEKNVEDTT
jgi:hypothetical protein